jgi:outer membrane lipoprotein SlyB
MRELLRVLLVGGVVMACLACAAKRPALYPNAQLEAVGSAAAEDEVNDCLAKAAAAGHETNATGQVAGSTALGAATGAALGAAVGAFAGGAGTGAAMGAAGGGSGGLIRGLFHSRDLNPVQQQFVEQCLKDKGYQVIGWQ